ncbi:hypothetical protein QTP70_004091 [Hemibagrus guttatus]|uniref:UPAR/Ly6 domain-containing protein n=1 Tax=Hemibagrus guttatus TaxID=175788 RepID=A0AAE0QD43_9TELE|nr:hypothetical protein QTP70_004091 [Hemibagrus guttatus]
MNKAIVVFLKSESLVNQLSVDGIWVRGAHVTVTPLSAPATRITMPNVLPFVPNNAITKELKRFALSLMCHNCISKQCSEINCPDQCASVTLFIVSNAKNMTSVIKTCAIPQMCSSGSINLGELLMTSNVMCCNSTLCNKETLPVLIRL